MTGVCFSGAGRAARWLASSLSHGLWFGYLLGMLAMTLALLSAQRFTFVWETTILNADAYVWLTEILAAIPGALGIAVPDRAAVLAARQMADAGEAQGQRKRAQERPLVVHEQQGGRGIKGLFHCVGASCLSPAGRVSVTVVPLSGADSNSITPPWF